MIRTEWLHTPGCMATQKNDVVCDECGSVHEWIDGYVGEAVNVATPLTWGHRMRGRVLEDLCPQCKTSAAA